MLGYLAFLLTVAGAVCFYLGSRNQRWRRTVLPRKAAMMSASVLLILALVFWTHTFRLDTGLFIFLTLLMLLWSCFPFLGRQKRSR